ncbi:MAG: hypothetical protein DMF50_12715 [Acidobacteria bacterium]|nr:MAG: hypothetical protein DMF50_12715 [Acidobacteriota bacterium]
MPPRAGATKRASRSTSRRPSRSRVITIRGSDDDLGIAVLAGPGNLVTTNDVSGVGGSGIAVNTSGNRVVGNVSSGNGCGICSSGSANQNVFERNHTTGNTSYGILMEGDFNLLDGNVSEGSGNSGIALSGTGNAYRNNMLRGNTGGAVIGVATDAGGNIL